MATGSSSEEIAASGWRVVGCALAKDSMFHSLLLLYSFFVVLFIIPLMGVLLRPALVKFALGIRTLVLLPLLVAKMGTRGAREYYQQRIQLSRISFSLLVFLLFANLTVVIVGIVGWNGKAYSLITGLFILGFAICLVHLMFGVRQLIGNPSSASKVR